MEKEFNTPKPVTAIAKKNDIALTSKGDVYAGWTVSWKDTGKVSIDISDVHVTIMNNGKVTFDCKVTSFGADEKQERGYPPGFGANVYFKNSSGASLAEWVVGIIPVDCNFKNHTVYKEGHVDSNIYNDVEHLVPELAPDEAYYHHC